ncbi:CSC1-like protein At3g54510 [Triticum urartu]|uniref:Membrane protein C2G11.09 n=1 Tax=Triticum urartu TaxID=4572 RepID=A0A8R7PM79_TRIUA|nr:CSC1-like protein At3g54510 [Triticum urartu]
MDAEGLLASAAINLGLALVALSLFSMLKKQPGNAPVYLPRRMAGAAGSGWVLPLGTGRLTPSFRWIRAAFRLSDDDVLRRHGLDALAVIRLFKLGINCFSVCSIVGVLILAPVNYTSAGPSGTKRPNSMEIFTVSNVPKGSDRLWVHFSCLCFISFYVVYLLHKEYKEMSRKRIEHLKHHRKRPDQFTILVQGIPVCADHGIYGCNVDHFFSKHYQTYQSYQILHDNGNIESLQKLASSLEKQIERKRDTRRCNFWQWIWFKFTSGPLDARSQEQKLKEVHHSIRILQCKNMLKQKELPVAFVSFKSRLEAAQAAETQQHVNPLSLVTRYAPEPTETIWSNLAIPFYRLAVYKLGVFIAAFLLTVFFTIPITAVQGIVQFEKIEKWFPPARAVQLIPGLSSVVTGYLPSMILNGFIYLIPFAMLGMASFEGCISRSRTEIKACNMVFYFLLGNVFFLSILSGSLLHQIGESFTHPKDIPSRLASAVSAQSDFFITYILTNGMSGFSFEVLQFGLLTWHFLKAHTVGHSDEPYLYGFPYYRVVPIASLAVLIGMVYAVVSPLLLPILVIYFLLGYAVFINQMEDVYDITYDTCGQYWPTIHHYIFLAVTLMQTTMIGLFGLKSKPGASIATIPLLVLNIMFNEYCKVRFLPTFQCRPIQICKDNDDLDKTEGEAECSSEHAVRAYTPPWMRPTGSSPESSSVQPLVRCLI